MKIGEAYIAKHFVRALCELADGNLKKSFRFSTIWVNTGISSINDEKYVRTKILDPCMKAGLLKEDPYGSFRITREGIYYASKHFELTTTTLGYLSKRDLIRGANIFLQTYKNLKKQGKQNITISDIWHEALLGLTLKSVRQIAEYLVEEGKVKLAKRK